MQHDPFENHSELRDKIKDPLTSFFRTTDVGAIMANDPKMAAFRSMLYTPAERLAFRDKALADHDGDLWIFAYGSLMWDPAIRFDKVLRAYAPDYSRAFILKDIYGGRGTPDAPGLMAALDQGDGCEGLVFRVPAATVAEETALLWRREMMGRGYQPAMIPTTTALGPITALTFLADHDADCMIPAISRTDQVHFAATGKGFLGTSLAYLTGIYDQFQAIGIIDHDVDSLLAEVLEYRAALAMMRA